LKCQGNESFLVNCSHSSVPDCQQSRAAGELD
jgi:hypothetical protein